MIIKKRNSEQRAFDFTPGSSVGSGFDGGQIELDMAPVKKELERQGNEKLLGLIRRLAALGEEKYPWKTLTRLVSEIVATSQDYQAEFKLAFFLRYLASDEEIKRYDEYRVSRDRDDKITTAEYEELVGEDFSRKLKLRIAPFERAFKEIAREHATEPGFVELITLIKTKL